MGRGLLECKVKTAVITGASTGIGAATARRFLKAGYRVINLSRRPLAEERVENLPGDLRLTYRDKSFSKRLCELTQDASALVLIHNACLHYGDTVGDLSDEQLDEVLTLNVRVPNRLNHLLIPCMQPSSSILYVGSTLSEKAVPGAFSYVVSKHALVGMMRATTQDLVGTGIHSACICPGFTDTEMLRRHMGDDPKIRQSITERSAENRLIEPAEIAELLFFAAHSPSLNGAVIQAGLGQKET